MKTGLANHDFTRESKPIDYFFLIFTPSLMQEIMTWTNDRAKQKIDNQVRRSQKKAIWRDLTFSEI
jgi:hypothetical protein